MLRHGFSALTLLILSLILPSCDAVTASSDAVDAAISLSAAKSVQSHTISEQSAEFVYGPDKTIDIEFDLAFPDPIQGKATSYQWLKRDRGGKLRALYEVREVRTAEGFNYYLNWHNSSSEPVSICFNSGPVHNATTTRCRSSNTFFSSANPTQGLYIGKTVIDPNAGFDDNDPRIKSKHVSHKGSVTYDYYPGPDDFYPTYRLPNSATAPSAEYFDVSHVTIEPASRLSSNRPDVSRIEWPYKGRFVITSM